MSASDANHPEPPPGDVSQAVEHLFRHEAGKMVSILTGIFGLEHLNLAEDVIQEALARALQTWPYYGIPKNPSAWIMRVSRNLALDVVRRETVFRSKEPEITALMEQRDPGREDQASLEQELKDDGLRMMFVCCHPLIPQEAQVALALKTLCGFGIGEISRAFLTSEAAIAKRLTRAGQKIREARIPFEIPTGEEASRRLDGVLQTLYLLFNEGYKASSGEKLVREELCHEALRLARLLSEHPAGNQPRTHALLALMLLNAARLRTRTDDQGRVLRLKEQDRSGWDRAVIARGMFHLAQSAGGDELTEYHLQAGIAACHCAAADYESTDWLQILSLYDHLLKFDDSPVIALNRAVAVANVHGPQAGLEAVTAIPNRKKLDSYYLYFAVLGEFEELLDHPQVAAMHFRKAAQLTDIKSEQSFLSNRGRACEARIHSRRAQPA
ncbi:MAG TPA: sigma-70 family RNA polymerase sigma factor [Candidatus Acidoferrum sp.]|nr:sigma-70 family RNA polymerase sigma factor [Candidatus Acidoferrum sp.]